MNAGSTMLPCPFCGGPGVLCEGHHNHWYAACSRCGVCRSTFANGGVEQDKARAIRSWNARAAIQSRPPIGTDEVVGRVVREAAEPWADYHGDLPDYDHPLRPVFESGVQYTVELLAKMLQVEDYEICDGTEEFDGDLGGTLLNIVIKTWPADEHGDWIDFRDPKNRIAAMPAIDQDGGEG